METFNSSTSSEVSNETVSKIPLILHSNLYGKDLIGFLGKNFKVKVSSNISEDTMILPRSGVAILVLRHRDLFHSEEGHYFKVPKMRKTKHNMLFEGEGTEDLEEGAADDVSSAFARAKAFGGQHANPVIIALGTSFGEEEVSALSHLQIGQLPRPPLLLMAHGEAQLAMHVKGLSKRTRKEIRAELRKRELEVQANLIPQDASSVLAWAMALSQQDAALLLDTFGSFSDIACLTTVAEIEQKLPASLNASVAASIFAFIEKDTFTL